ncbi:hypothetical protein KFE25_012747 [Diacronema lutheri]|uniref:CRAL-TRIO domain-containing protein n=2 Tax=Diacronema lutheri TaxID=2081491 RepID=A0A8J5XCC0_DIALT|nr:hypothetical protein KFE25_012747 [Diacronema lutheri]
MGPSPSRIVGDTEVFSTPATSPTGGATPRASKSAVAAVAPGLLAFGKYHPRSPLPTPGYKGNLSDAQQAALESLRTRMVELGLEQAVAAAVIVPAEDEDGLLLRFLRARQFDVAKAAELLRADLEWRAELRVPELATQSEAEVLGCDPAIFAHYLPGWYESVDLEGRVAQWQKWGDLRVDEVLQHTTHDRLLRHHVWQQEQLLRRQAENARQQHVWLAQCVTVVDAKHWHPGLASRAAMAFLRDIAGLDQLHYPERMGMIITINAPYTLSACYAIISTWLDPVTRAKVQIISGERYWRPLLEATFAPDQIPREYGGTAAVELRDLSARAKYEPH